jgi:hypothetical protein
VPESWRTRKGGGQSHRLRPLSVWYDNREIQGGGALADQFSDAIRASDRLMLMVSHSSLASEWVAYEVREAMKRDQKMSDREDLRRSLLSPIRFMSMEELRSTLEGEATDSQLWLKTSFPVRGCRSQLG